MALKRDELGDNRSTLNKAHPDEPLFILRAQDALAAQAVRYWAFLAQANGTPIPKVEEALRNADKMELWLGKKIPD